MYPLCHLWCLLMGHLVRMLGCFCITLLTWVGIGIDDARYFAIILLDSAIHFSMDIIDKIIIKTKTSVFLTIALLSHHYAKCPTTITQNLKNYSYLRYHGLLYSAELNVLCAYLDKIHLLFITINSEQLHENFKPLKVKLIGLQHQEVMPHKLNYQLNTQNSSEGEWLNFHRQCRQN